jgi:transposase InsO family protein
MKELLASNEFMGWPLYSIARHALRKNILSSCVNTWYKYAKLLGVERHKKKWHKGKTKGIRAEKIHEIWHADVTILKLANNTRAYIYLVVDNFSRLILAFRVALMLSAEIRKETIKEAYEKYILPTVKPEKTCLLVDGGSENNNEKVEEYLKNDAVTMEKIIAQADIEFSNSMIEAVNRTLKQRYLYYHIYPDIDTLEKIVEKAAYDYNEKCPHISHKGLTPREVLENITLNSEEILNQMEQSRIKRIAENRKANCGLC